jgi:hypothetical protein
MKSFPTAYSAIGRSIESYPNPYHSPKRVSQLDADWVRHCQVVKFGQRLAVVVPRLSQELRPMW